MAAIYAADHSSQLTGLFMLAAYPAKALNESMRAVMIYGSEDGVLDLKKMEEAKRYLQGGGEAYMIEGGNHAQFGNYGKQDQDGEAVISAEEQQRRTVEIMLQNR